MSCSRIAIRSSGEAVEIRNCAVTSGSGVITVDQNSSGFLRALASNTDGGLRCVLLLGAATSGGAVFPAGRDSAFDSAFIVESLHRVMGVDLDESINDVEAAHSRRCLTLAVEA